MILLYTAFDVKFARTALAALREAHIRCSCNLAIAFDDAPDTPANAASAPSDEPEIPEPPPEDFEPSPGDKPPDTTDRPYNSRIPPEFAISVYEESGYQRASAILLKLGAVPDNSLSAPIIAAINCWATRFAIIAATVVALYIWQSRR